LRPLYSGGGAGAVAQSLRSVNVAAIGGRSGWDGPGPRWRIGLGAPSGGQARYRLEVELDDDIIGFGIRRDDAVARERRTLRARYRLVDAAVGTVLLDATAGSDAGIDVVSPNMPRSRPSRLRSSGWRGRWPTRSSRVSRCIRPGPAPAGEGREGAVERALRSPSPAQRLILLYGPDEAGSRALAKLAGRHVASVSS
jgi:hypothetical protein